MDQIGFHPLDLKEGTTTPAQICPDCGETNCIYQEINNSVNGEGDQDIEDAIQKVCKGRGIKDSATIELIRVCGKANGTPHL